MPESKIKSPAEVADMAEGGAKLAEIIRKVLDKVELGVSTFEIDSWIEGWIIGAGGLPSFKRVPRYHWASCIGLNDEVVHSIPRRDRIVKEGDLLKIDTGVYWKGLHTDASWTTIVPTANSNQQSAMSGFLEAGKEALKRAIEAAKPGNRIGHISLAIQKTVEKFGFTPVRVLTGHGIGRSLHEEPMIPCFLNGRVEKTEELLPGMTLAIEVIYNQGGADVVMEEDNWTISTRDGRMSGLFEETIAVGENGPLVLTDI